MRSMRPMPRETDPFSAEDTAPPPQEAAETHAMMSHLGPTLSSKAQDALLRQHGYSLMDAQKDPSFPHTFSGFVPTTALMHWLGYQ